VVADDDADAQVIAWCPLAREREPSVVASRDALVAFIHADGQLEQRGRAREIQPLESREPAELERDISLLARAADRG
jgi:hypothetical protein